MEQQAVLNFYRRQSQWTDPGSMAALYADLPTDPPALAHIVQNVLIAPYRFRLSLYGLQPDDIDSVDFGLHRMDALLERIQQRAPGPLAQPRAPRDRIGAICRNFAALHVSLLRHVGIPARERVGFAGYLGGALFYDHRITQYWDAAQHRWILADAWVDAPLRQARGMTCDPLDLRPGDPFVLAGVAWQGCRRGERDPQQFGDSETDRGMPPIRYALLHDFAALNGYEVLGCDDWGDLITKPEADLTPADLALLDQIATLTLDADTSFADMHALFAATDYGQAVARETARVLAGSVSA